MKPEDITAWALNELTQEEREQIEAALGKDPATQQQARSTKAFCALLSEHLVDEDAAFTDDQRNQLKALELPKLDNVVPFDGKAEPARMNGKAFHEKVTLARRVNELRFSPWLTIGALAACLMLTLFIVNESWKMPSPASQTVALGTVKSQAPEIAAAAPLPAEPKLVAITMAPQPTPAPAAQLFPADPVVKPTIPQGTVDKLIADVTKKAASADPSSKAANLGLEAKNMKANGGNVTLDAAGSSKFTLSGANTYTGSPVINAGTLSFQSGDLAKATGSISPYVQHDADADIGLSLSVGYDSHYFYRGMRHDGGFAAVNGRDFSAYDLNGRGEPVATFGTGVATVTAGHLSPVPGATSNLADLSGSPTLSYEGLELGAGTPSSRLTFGSTSLAADSIDGLLLGGDRVSGTAVPQSTAFSGVITPALRTAGSTVSMGGNVATASPKLGDAPLDISGNAAPKTVTATGAGTLTKSGAGTLTLNTDSTFSGGTTINGGTLAAAPTVTTKSGQKGTRPLDSSANSANSFAVGNTGGATIASAGRLTVIGSTSAAPTPPPAQPSPMADTGALVLTGGVAGGTPGAPAAPRSDAPMSVFTDTLVTDAKPAPEGASSIAQRELRRHSPALDQSRAKVVAQVGVEWEDRGPADPFGSPQIPQGLAKSEAEARATRAKEALSKDAPSPVAKAKSTTPPGTERYAKVIENPYLTVASQPLSTFSIDVDTASYANVRRFLNHGQLPPPDAVRLEEMINYFPYAYEQPGKDQPFSVQVDVAEAPWAPLHRLARVAIKGRDVGLDRPSANFVFLVDVSGSMDSPERLPLVKMSLEMLTAQLRDDDHVSIVTYAGDCHVALESTSGKNKATIMGVIRGLNANGSTNGASGITLAYEQAAANFVKGGINRVVLCTDGDFNVGISDPRELEKLIKEKAKGGTFLSVLGYGMGNLKDHTMQTLADNGNGNYAYIDSLGEARKVLVEQMTGTLITIAKDVKIQVEFNPTQIASYRLIGYEKRLLAAQDFNNDKKDAGEIGAGHTITALYELIPVGVPQANGALAQVDDLKYQPKKQAEPKVLPDMAAKSPLAKLDINNEAMTVKLRYKEPDGQVSKLIEYPVHDTQKKLEESPRDFRFATAVAGFGMLLRGSEHTEDFSFESVRRLALSGKGDDALGYRGEFIQLIDKANGLCSTQQ